MYDLKDLMERLEAIPPIPSLNKINTTAERKLMVQEFLCLMPQFTILVNERRDIVPQEIVSALSSNSDIEQNKLNHAKRRMEEVERRTNRRFAYLLSQLRKMKNMIIEYDLS